MASKTRKSCVCSGKRQDVLEEIKTPRTPKSQSLDSSAGTARTSSRPGTQGSMRSHLNLAPPKSCTACDKFISDLTFKFREAWMREDLALQFQLVTAVPDLLTRDEGGLEDLALRFRCNVGFIKLAQVQRREAGPLTYPLAAAPAPAAKQQEPLKPSAKVAFAEAVHEEPIAEASGDTSPTDEVRLKVLQFYWEHSRSIPKNAVLKMAVTPPNSDGNAIYRVVKFDTPHEALAKFREEHGDKKEFKTLNLEAFKDLKPVNFIWPLNTPFECTSTACRIHENFKLMLKAGSVQDSIDQVLEKLLCKRMDEDCMLFDCVNSDCPKQFADVYPTPSGDIILKQWQKHDGKHRLDEEIVAGREYPGIFESALRAFAPHHFVAEVQAKYIEEQAAKDDGAVIIYCGQGKDCSFELTAVTFHPFHVVLGDGTVVYYVVVSDVRSKDQGEKSWAFHAFRSKVIEDIKKQGTSVTKFVYVSDTKKQHRNWINAANLASHEEDFGDAGEWIFMPKGHFKSECETVEAMVAQEMALEAEERNESGIFEIEEVNKGQRIFKVLVRRLEAVGEGRVKVVYVGEDEVEGVKMKLKSRIYWSESQGKLNGISKSHFWTVEEKGILETSKKFIVFKEHVKAVTEVLAVPLD